MVGTWFGHGQPDDKDAMYIDRMRADGSWRGEYRTCVKGKPLDQVQEGHWTLQGDTLSLRVDTVNGMRAPRTDLYKMLAHTATTQKYLSLGWNFPYTPSARAGRFQDAVLPADQLMRHRLACAVFCSRWPCRR